MNVHSAAATTVGRVRKNNEDNFYLCGEYRSDVDIPDVRAAFSDKRDRYLFGVCDGMGGEAYGELASLIAVRHMADHAEHFDEKVNEYVRQANAEICREIKARGGKRIGTTLAVLSIANDTANAYNIGDSRVYHIRDGAIRQISEDHTQIQMLVRHGLVSRSDAGKHPAKHVLTQHLGIFPDEMIIEPFHAGPIMVRSGDAFLLCSDGLTDTLSDGDLLELVSSDKGTEEKADALIRAALDTGSRDNVTVVLAEVSDDDPGIAKAGVDLAAAEATLRKYGTPEREGLISEIMEILKTRVR